MLLRPDNLAKGVRNTTGDICEMRATFDGWDPMYVLNSILKICKTWRMWRFMLTRRKFSLTKLISCISTCTKWKLCDLSELQSWTEVSNMFASVGQAADFHFLEQYGPNWRRLPPHTSIPGTRSSHGSRRWRCTRRDLGISQHSGDKYRCTRP